MGVSNLSRLVGLLCIVKQQCQRLEKIKIYRFNPKNEFSSFSFNLRYVLNFNRTNIGDGETGSM